MINKTLKLLKNRNFILYVIIGLSGATIDFLTYLVLHLIFNVQPAIASFISVSFGIINNFLINSRHNFKVDDRLWFRFINFYTIGLGGALLSALLIFYMYNLLGIDATIAKLLTIPPVVLLQYFLNVKFSFKLKENKD